MGQKVHPKGFRTGIYRDWDSQWFARRGEYAKLLVEDVKIRDYIEKRLPGAEISTIKIFKAGDNIRIDIYSARPGIVIGRQGREIEALRDELGKLLGRKIELSSIDETIVKNAQQISNQYATCHCGDNKILSLCQAKNFVLVTFDRMLLKTCQFLGVTAFHPKMVGGI